MSRLFVVAALLFCATACRYKGNTYTNNETWEENGAFKMRCVIEDNGSWRTEVASCLTPDKEEIPVNHTKALGAHEWSCTLTGDGHISLKQELSKNADCPGGQKRGDQWVEKSFEFECGEGGQPKFKGCVTSSGIKIADGETKEVSGIMVKCQKHPNGTISLNGVGKAADADCVDANGIRHKNGEKWVQNKHFEVQCRDGGESKITGCVIPGVSKVVPLGGTLEVANMEYHCENENGSYKFYNKPKN